MYIIFTSITFPSSHLFSELCELCGWQFPPRTPLRGISWGRQCPAANQKMAPSPWDQLQQLQRPRRQVVCLPNAEALRYLARAAGKLLVCCLHPNQGHTGHLPTLPMSMGTLKQGVRTASKAPKKGQWEKEVGWGWTDSPGVETIHSDGTLGTCYISLPLSCVLQDTFILYDVICSLHTQWTIIHKLPQFVAHSRSKPVPPLSQILPPEYNSFIFHICFQTDKHARTHSCPVKPANTAAPCIRPLTAQTDTLTLEHHYDTETRI